jgi:DNA invertase Pin-like site-specific DNA recombinase
MCAAWSVDRLGLSLQNLLAFLLEAIETGGLILHRQALDTSMPMGKAMFQQESSQSSSGQSSSCGEGQSQGQKLGRPRTNPKVEQRLRQLAAQRIWKAEELQPEMYSDSRLPRPH